LQLADDTTAEPTTPGAEERATAARVFEAEAVRMAKAPSSTPGLGLGRPAVDLLSLLLAMLLAIAWTRAVGVQALAAFYAFPFIALALLFSRGLYRPRLRLVVLEELASVVGAISIAAMVNLALTLVVHSSENSGSPIARAWLASIILVPLGRALLASSQRRRRVDGAAGEPALIVGAGRVGGHVARRLLAQPEYGLRPVGFLDAHPPQQLTPLRRSIPLLGTPEDVLDVARRTGAQKVILAFTWRSDRQCVPLVRACHDAGIDTLVVPRFFDTYNERTTLEHLGGIPLLGLRRADPNGWEFAVKHAADRVLAAVLLFLLSPLLCWSRSPSSSARRDRCCSARCAWAGTVSPSSSSSSAPCERRARTAARSSHRQVRRRVALRDRIGARRSAGSFGGPRSTSSPSSSTSSGGR
jgi:hypothetical protein